MSVLIATAILVIFFIMAGLMYTRRVSALLALPIMALVIAAVGGISGQEILDDVITKGSVKLHMAYTTTMFGAVLAELMNRHGIAKALVRWVAEFAGDNPYVLGVILTLVTALLFSTLGGLGAVIMIGTIILPVMLSIGISTATAGGLYLFGISLGGMFNLANWQFYVDVLKVDQSVIVQFVVPFAFVIAIAILLFLAIELRTMKNLKYLLGGVALLGTGLLLTQSGFSGSLQTAATAVAVTPPPTPIVAPWSITASLVVLAIMVCYAIWRGSKKVTNLSWLALLTPVLPLFLVLACGWGIMPAFIAAITYGVLATWQKDSITMLTRSIIDGITTVIPAVFLMIGIGMLIAAVSSAQVAGAIGPLIAGVVPTTAFWYVVMFSLMTPFALYRGPLSLWGMGSGLIKLIQESTTLSGQAIMGMLMSVGQVQGICDPTNTHNIWIATYLGTDTQTLFRKTVVYAWLCSLFGLILACALKFVPIA
ncbi:MAG: citrate transporter [Candidatus Melainabacteria bacterium]|nr:citrate transporter [Candidatus Melainabacteria bacterium]